MPQNIFREEAIETHYSYGWPFTALRQNTLEMKLEDQARNYVKHGGRRFEYRAVGGDLAIALTLLFASWFLCEWVIRCRAARKVA